MATFNEMNHTSDYERQSWRDSYNGGRAAGDITGNVNKQLDRERQSFGTTWSGSSSQPSALELARSGGGASYSYVAGSGGAAAIQVQTKGPGASGIAAGPTAGPGASGVAVGPTKGVGGTGAVGGGPRRDGTGIQLPVGKPSALTPIYMGGRRMALDRGWSDAQDGENRWGENEFLSPSWFHAWGVAGADMLANAREVYADTVQKAPKATQFQPGGGAWITEAASNWWSEANSPFGPDHPIVGFDGGGF